MILVIKGPYVLETEDKRRNDTYHVERELLAVQVSSPQNAYRVSHAEQTQCRTNVFAQTDCRGLDSGFPVMLLILWKYGQHMYPHKTFSKVT
jgi:hypothetical protein